MRLNWFIAVLIGIVLGIILCFIDPLYGMVIGFGIIAGSLFQALFLLNDIQKRLSMKSSKPVRINKVQQAMDDYRKERDQNQG